MKNKGMTITIVFEAESLNYGEGIGNVTSLKKITRNNGESFTYISRQALTYDLRRIMNINNTPLSLDRSVIQFAPEATIYDNPEIDLFGYMKTGKSSKTRSAIVRVSNAISLEGFNAELDFLTNKGLLDRYNLTSVKAKNGGNISQSEIHKSFYVYTITVDLDKVGIDINDMIEISKEEKVDRIINLLDAVKFLHRDIKGRRENLSPVFAIGGIYDIKNPFFENRVKLSSGGIDINPIKDTMNLDSRISDNTAVAIVKGIFKNDSELESELHAVSINDFFDSLEAKVREYYL